MVKFLHTADCHLGKKYIHLGDKAEEARRIRLQTFENLINLGIKENVDFFLIAGDLFDNNELDRDVVNDVCEILVKASPTQVYILPGNHDPLTKDSLYYEKAWKAVENVIILNEESPINVPYTKARIYPCPITKKDSDEDPTEWIECKKDEISIGIAHGNLQIEGQYTNFPINPKRAEIANLNYLALGEWHSFQEYSNGIHTTVYPGTPETTAFKDKRSGNVAIVNIEDVEKSPLVKLHKVGKLKWEKIEQNVSSLVNITSLENDLKLSYGLKDALLNLKLSGVVDEESFDYLKVFRDNLNKCFMFFKLDCDELYLKPSLIEFKAAIPEGTLLINTLKALMTLMKFNHETQPLSTEISFEDAESIFHDIKSIESVQKVSPEVLREATILLYQLLKEDSQ